MQHLRGRRSYPIRVARTPIEIDLKIFTNSPAGLLDLSLEHAGAKLTLGILLRVHHE
jgi:hypothetical protein